MKLEEFKKAGHWPTLLAAFLYFDISFMAWVSLGPLMIYIAKDMHLPVEDKLSLVAIPVLAGAFFRLPLGLIADAIGSQIAASPRNWSCSSPWRSSMCSAFPARWRLLYSASRWASPAPPSPWRCRRRAAGIRRIIRVS